MGAALKPLACALSLLASASVCLADAAAPISVEWRLVGPHPESGYAAELTLRNDSAEALPAEWTLYFNASSRLLPESVAAPFVLAHVNGDFYSLRPKQGTPAIAAGESRVVGYRGSPWAINVSDAPSGFYLVARDEAGNELPPVAVAIRIGEFPDEKQITRGAGDTRPIVTPAMRFAENAKLTLLAQEDLPRVLPTPVKVTEMRGEVTIDGETTIYHDAKLLGEAKFLAAALQLMLGAPLRIKEGGEAPAKAIRLRIGDVIVAGDAKKAGDEAYRLTVDPAKGIEIAGTDAAGVFYGIQSLRALLPIAAYRESAPQLTVDAVQIEDAPRFSYRGMHLDVGRNFQSKAAVKKLLDLMGFYKLNRFHWHLTDDEGWRIEVKALPELTAVGGRRGHTLDELGSLIPSYGSGADPEAADSAGNGFYTQEDVVEILQYAAERHIEVIPELDLPGHSRAAIKAMDARAKRLRDAGDSNGADEFLLTDPADKSQYESVQMWRDNVVDVGMESTYRFVDVVVGELVGVYRRAGLELKTVHLGGDEVPKGAWEKSPACATIPLEEASGFTRNQQLQLHFLERAGEILTKHGIRTACWEDCLLFKDGDGRIAAESARAKKLNPLVYVWNNVWGWGNEDAAYRLANAGYDTVLCNATHLYLDLACEKDPQEIGYYWAGFVDDRKPFEFNPLDVFQNADRDSMGNALGENHFAERVRLTDAGKTHVLGIQGELWGENLRSQQTMEYMAFPRAIAVAERAWTSAPTWTKIADRDERATKIQDAWNNFANAVGQRELPRLDVLAGSVEYRLSPPGAQIREGKLHANTAYPGLTIRYTIDGSEPTAESALYKGPLPVSSAMKLRAFDTRGRGSRTVTIAP